MKIAFTVAVWFVCIIAGVWVGHHVAAQEKTKSVGSLAGTTGIGFIANPFPSGSMVLFSDTIKAGTVEIDGPAGEMLVKISLTDGKMTFGKSYTPDAAGKAFWDAITIKYPCMTRKEGKP